ncbi:MAG: hypothetical protein IJY93_03775 [Clostridia bacterium]|nr:hypothetical protein [Clostridia bacterium]
MKKIKLISFILTAMLALQFFAAGAGAAIVKTENKPVTVGWEDEREGAPLSISEPLPDDNKLSKHSSFDFTSSLHYFSPNGQTIEQIEDENGSYLKMRDIYYAWMGFTFQAPREVDEGKYKFSGYFRTANPGEITMLRVQICDISDNMETFYVYCGNEWVKADYYIDLPDKLYYIKVLGGPYNELTQEYCVDQFSLVPVDEIPENKQTEFGDKLGLDGLEYAVYAKECQLKADGTTKYDAKKNAKYDVGGIIINSDCTQFVSSAAGETCTEEDIINFAKQFKDTHVTDYFMNVAAWNTVYPSDNYVDYVDKYYLTLDRGQEVDYTTNTAIKGARYIFETLATDYFGLWHEAFRSVGINPWISFRMNDIHETYNTYTGLPSYGADEFLYNAQQRGLMRGRYLPKGTATTALDYTYEEVRNFFLALIDESVARYGSYGIELDFMREIWLFYPGGEYNGLEIMNDFMRDVNEILAKYELRYGHDIKVAVRVPSDIQTAYDFGLDVGTWAAEGLIDMIIPTSRWETTDADMPIKTWASMFKPYGIEIAAGVEQRNMAWPDGGNGGHSIETFAALAANYFSQGADKMYFYNYFLGVNDVFTDDIKISTDSTYYSVYSLEGYWNAITSLGSYDKVMTMNRRHMITYNDITPTWRNTNVVLPAEITNKAYKSFRVAVGDVSEGSKLYLKIACDNADVFADKLPTVYVNSELCTYLGSEKGSKANTGIAYNAFTTNNMLVFEIPTEAHDETYMYIDIMSNEAIESFKTDYVEVYVKAHD